MLNGRYSWNTCCYVLGVLGDFTKRKRSTRMFYDWSLFKQSLLSQRVVSRSSVVEPISLRCTKVNKESTSATRVVPLCHLFEVYRVLTYYQADTQWLLSFFTTQPSLFHVLISFYFACFEPFSLCIYSLDVSMSQWGFPYHIPRKTRNGSRINNRRIYPTRALPFWP